MSVGIHNLAPRASVASVIHVVLDFVNVGNSFAEVPAGTLLVRAVLDVNKSLAVSLGLAGSSVASEHTTSIKSDGCADVLCFSGSFAFFCHISLHK